MYNGIGLPTARGSGTNAYVTKNLATVYKREKISDRNSSKGDHADRRPNKDILEHARKRKIEVKCAEYTDILEAQGLTENEIELKLESYRQFLKSNDEYKQEPDDKWIRNVELGTHEIAEANIRKNNLLREAFGLSTDFVDGSSFEKREREAKEKAACQKTYELVRTPEPSLDETSDIEMKNKEDVIKKKLLKKTKRKSKKKNKLESSSKAKKSKKSKKKNKTSIEDSAESSEKEHTDSDDDREKVKKKGKKQKSKTSKKRKEVAIDDSAKSSESECDTDSDDEEQVRKKMKMHKLKKNRKNESKKEHGSSRNMDHHPKNSKIRKREKSSSSTSESEESRKLSSDGDSLDNKSGMKRKKGHKRLEDKKKHKCDKSDVVKSSWDVKCEEKRKSKNKENDHESSFENKHTRSLDNSTDKERGAKCHLVKEDPNSLKHSWKIDYPQSRDHKNQD